MAQLDFFLCKDEKLELIEFCLENGCSLVPDFKYGTNIYTTLTSAAEYLDYYNKSLLFFIIHEDYTLYPLQMRAFEKDGMKKYFIDQRYGGPTIDFYSPSLAEIEDNRIGPGFVGIYPFYYHNDEKFIPPPAIKDVYKLISSFIKKRCTRVKLQKRYYWVGNRTIELLRDGKCKMVDFTEVNWENLLS